jgi:hypothetical protein
MTIEATQRKAMAAGQTLTAKYKGTEYTAEVVAGEGGKLLYRLADGREFKSPSSAGSAVMGGTACNGWRFWSVAGASTTTKPEKETATAKPAKQTVAKATRPNCDACGKSFVSEKQLEHHRANAERLCRPA